MALPRQLKNFNLFGDGRSFMGVVEEIALPKLARKTEDYRGGGMNAPVKTVTGMEGIEIEHTYGGFMKEIYRQFGGLKVDGVLLRFAGAYQQDDTSEIEAVEIVVRGRHTEIDPGTAKGGDSTKFKVMTAASYYKLTVNGRTEAEIDILNMIEIIDGVDQLAAQRAALGV